MRMRRVDHETGKTRAPTLRQSVRGRHRFNLLEIEMNEINTSSGFGLVPATWARRCSLPTFWRPATWFRATTSASLATCGHCRAVGSQSRPEAAAALQNIAVMNGRPALWGDAVVALVRGSGATGVHAGDG